MFALPDNIMEYESFYMGHNVDMGLANDGSIKNTSNCKLKGVFFERY
jgi:hypothetical protein